MNYQGTQVLDHPVQRVWDALFDPTVLRQSIAGCESFERSSDTEFNSSVKVSIGPVSARFASTMTLLEMTPPSACTLRFAGQGGVAGFGKGESSVEIKPLEKGCELHYTVHSSVGGKIAQLGQRLIDGVAKNMAEDFFKRFEAELEKRYPPAEEPVPQESAPAQTSAGVPVWMWAAGAAVALAVVVMVTR